MKAYGGSRGTGPLILNLGGGTSGPLRAPVALPLGKNSGTHSAAGWVGPRASLEGFEEKNFFPPPGF